VDTVRRFRIGVIAVTVVAALSACNWPAVGYGPDNQSYNPYETRLTAANVGTLRRAFTVDAGDLAGVPIVGGDAVVVSGSERVDDENDEVIVRGFDRATGERRWEYRGDPVFAEGTTPFTVPLITGPHTVTFSHGRTTTTPGVVIYTNEVRVDTRDGTVLSDDVPDPKEAIVSARGDQVLRAGIGLRWDSPPPFPVTYVRVAGRSLAGLLRGRDNGLTMGTDRLWASIGDEVSAFELDTSCDTLCTPAWMTEVDGTVTQTVLGVDGRTVYVGTAAGTAYAIDGNTGAVLWSTPLGSGAITQAPALANGTLYFTAASRPLIAVRASDGAVTWQEPYAARGFTSRPVVAGGLVYGGTDSGVTVYDAAGCGAPTCGAVAYVDPFSSNPPIAQPTRGIAVANGHLYFTAGTRLYAYAPSG
jgi:outer membrane protein assembly factor BamB